MKWRQFAFFAAHALVACGLVCIDILSLIGCIAFPAGGGTLGGCIMFLVAAIVSIPDDVAKPENLAVTTRHATVLSSVCLMLYVALFFILILLVAVSRW